MRYLASLLSAALLSLAPMTHAQAQGMTVIDTGTYDSQTFLWDSGSVSLGAGTYLFSLSTTAPLEYLFGYVEKTTVTNEFCDFGQGEVYCGGNDVPIQPLFEMINPSLYQLTLQVDSPSTVLSPNDFVVRQENFDTCCSYYFDFEGLGPGSYTFSQSLVPEPSAWMMMILGFGMLGAAVRRRRTTAAGLTTLTI